MKVDYYDQTRARLEHRKIVLLVFTNNEKNNIKHISFICI